MEKGAVSADPLSVSQDFRPVAEPGHSFKSGQSSVNWQLLHSAQKFTWASASRTLQDQTARVFRNQLNFEFVKDRRRGVETEVKKRKEEVREGGWFDSL